jgi:nitrogen fixation NifU-like protein
MITDVQIEGGTVRVAVDLPAHHQFAANIREEIVEKLESRWDVDRVIVEFTE